MAKYTVEDIEIIRQKSGLSYEEAVNLLEYHNGSLARSLVDLEKNGRLKRSAADSESGKGLFNYLFHLRVKVTNKDVPIINLSSIFMLIALLVAPHICIGGLIVSLVLGYRISIRRNSHEFEDDTFDSIVKKAKSNVKNTVNGIAGAFSQDGSKAADASQVREKSKPEAPEKRSEAPASGTRPVNVPFTEGERADVKPDGDGYYEIDIR